MTEFSIHLAVQCISIILYSCLFTISGAPPRPPEAGPLEGEPSLANVLMVDELTGELIMPEGKGRFLGTYTLLAKKRMDVFELFSWLRYTLDMLYLLIW